jgi:carbamoyl-phosphate synthase large subunit
MVDSTLDQLSHQEMVAPRDASRRPRVLVTGTGGSSGIAVLGALSAEKLDIFSADVDPHAPGLYLVDEDRRLPIPEGDRDSYTELVYELCERHRIDVLIPTTGRELVLLASARAFFTEVGTRIVLASEKTLRMCLDRWALHRRCTRAGSGSRGVQLIERREELKRIERDGSLLVQEHLPGAEYSLNTLARSDGRVIVVPWARSKVDSCVAATWRAVRDDGLEAIGRRIAERIGLTSVVNIQVKETFDGEPALLEVNPSFPGTTPLTVASGVNMPKLCVDDALDLPLPEDAEGVGDG